jgi:hypothetical protein
VVRDDEQIGPHVKPVPINDGYKAGQIGVSADKNLGTPY